MTLHYLAAEGVPEALLDRLKPEKGYVFWTELWKPHLATMSDQIFTAYEGKSPLLFIGSVRVSFLNAEAEVWCITTEALKWFHLPELRGMWRSWLPNYTGVPLYARCHSGSDAKFARWFGGTLAKAENGIEIYRMTR